MRITSLGAAKGALPGLEQPQPHIQHVQHVQQQQHVKQHAPLLGPSMTGNPLGHNHDAHGIHPHGHKKAAGEKEGVNVDVLLMC